jgi:hypothetical protein
VNRISLLLVASVSLVCSLPLAAQSLPLQPGQYEISSVTALGSTAGEKPETASRCIRNEDLSNPEAVLNNRFMADFKPDATCTVSGLVINAGKVSYATDCKYAKVQVQGTVTSSSYSVIRKATSKGGKGGDAETRLEGKRTGACT